MSGSNLVVTFVGCNRIVGKFKGNLEVKNTKWNRTPTISHSSNTYHVVAALTCCNISGVFPHNFVEEHNIQNIEVNDIQIGEVVGYGGFGKIYKGTYNGKEVILEFWLPWLPKTLVTLVTWDLGFIRLPGFFGMIMHGILSIQISLIFLKHVLELVWAVGCFLLQLWECGICVFAP